MRPYNSNRGWLVVLLAVVCFSSVAQAGRPGWQRQEVDWRLTGGDRIIDIRYPEQKEPPLFNEKAGPQTRVVRKRILPNASRSEDPTFSILSVPTVIANMIDSPPVAGFVPWIAVAVTDKRSDDMDWVAEAHTSVVGQYLTNSPETDFSIGLFDTGASVHLMGYAAAKRAGIYAADLLTPNTVEIIGATNSVFAGVSQPLAIFMDGLAAIDPNGMTFDDSNMVGQSNVSVVVGDEPLPDHPDLPVAIGSPMSVNFVTVISNDRPITITYDGNDYTSPDIRFYDYDDAGIPDYANHLPLNFIPSSAINVQYIPDLDSIMDFVFQPGQPSTVVGNLAQSLFFVDSVDLHNGTFSAIDKDRFMLDTGAQITVIGSSIGSRLGLDPANPDFEVDIEDVTGDVTINPGFYIDSLDIPALGSWLSYTNVPVVLLDVSSPEGGALDGIIGMNLFTNFNLVLRGGGLPDYGGHSLDFEPIVPRPFGDIAPGIGDGIVDLRDIAALANSWLATPESLQWNSAADIAPVGAPDGRIDFLDFAVMAENWLATTTP
ncbi:MAG: retropepsin-like aspartic protease [Sedimentisphaerales bacterium]